MPNEVWLVRHGVTAANRDGVIQGQTDVPLAPAGVDQANALAQWLASNEVAFDAAVSSPLGRAQQTLAALQGRFAGAATIDDRWMEASYGEYEGQPGTLLRDLRALPDADAAAAAPPGGESMNDLTQRSVAALEDWVHRDCGERLLVVTHGGPIAAIVCHLLRTLFCPATSIRFRRDNTGITVLRRRRDPSGELQIAALNATPHLGADTLVSSRPRQSPQA